MTPWKKYAAIFGAGLLFAALLAASYGVGRDSGLRYAAKNAPPPDTITVVKRIAAKNPPILAAKPLKAILVPLPVLPDSAVNYTTVQGDSPAAPADTAAVEVPIEQAYYHGEGYEAWVSGFMPRLDSIAVYQRTQTIIQTQAAPPPSRWSFGITAGPAVVWTGSGFAGGLGVAAGIQFRF